MTKLIDLTRRAHALCYVITEAPEVDDIAALAKHRCMLDNGRLEACLFEPKCKRGAGNTCARNQD
jgi:hypothetical protein